MRILLASFILLSWALCLHAQPLYKDRLSLQASVWARAEAYQAKGSFFFGEMTAVAGNKDAGRLASGPWTAVYLKAGYERLLTPQWQIGAYYQLQRFQSDRIRQGMAYLRHNGRISSLIFLKEIGWSRLDYQLAQSRDSWQWHVGVYLGKRLPWKDKHWQIGIRGFASRLTGPVGDARRFSYTQLQLRADFPLRNHLALSLFVEKQVHYYFGLAQDRYDKDGNFIESIPYHRLNQVLPVTGVSLRWIVGAGKMNEAAPFNLWKP